MKRVPFGRTLLTLWGGAALVVSAYLLGSHLVALPATKNAHLTAAVAAYAHERGPVAGQVLVHVLYQSCRCSQRVVTHLLERGAAPGDRELVLLVGDAADPATERELHRAGYDVRDVAPEALGPTYGVEAAPLLVVANAAGAVSYVGGYNDRKQSPVIRDREIATHVAQGRAVEPLPLFGCAVSENLRAKTDPLGVLR